MRKIASFASKAEADRFRWFLHSNQIACHSGDDDSGDDDSDNDANAPEDIWVLSDDDVGRAKQLHHQYLTAPTTLPLADMIAEGKRQLASAEKAAKKQQRAPSLQGARLWGPFPITVALVSISAIVFLLGFLGLTQNSTGAKILMLKLLRFSLYTGTSFIEIRQGQLWRLFTPMFLHDGLLHIFFNMMWLWLLARQVEACEGSLKLLVLVATISSASHIAFYLVAGPNFGGMSGVNYGLAAYIWCMDQWGGHHGYRSDPSQSQFFVVWYIACLVLTLFGMRVANTIHGVGALAGFFVAFMSSRRYKQLPLLLRRARSGKQAAAGVVLLIAGFLVDYLTY